jgi:hypothetical protein
MNNGHTPTLASRHQLPYQPRRYNTTPSQRPSTSSGEAIEPISDFLADALRERKGLTPRSQSTTPRRAKPAVRSQAYQATHDEWMPSSDEERREARRRAGRPIRARRASDLSAVKSSPGAVRALGTRETTTQLDKLQKENWDLKHRVTLQQDRVKQLNEQLEETLEELEKAKELRQTNEELNEALEILSKKVASSEEDMITMTELHDDLIKELELRDTGIKERQLAIEEAAGIIQTLELKVETLQQTTQTPLPKQDLSDYFSGDADVAFSPKKNVTNGPTLAITAPDSDYFSADTSPNITPKTPRKMQLPSSEEKLVQLEKARETGASFNRELGLRTAASKDSLLSTFLDTRDLPPSVARTLARTLRRRSPTPGIQESQQARSSKPIVDVIRRVATPPWSNSRPLRSLYEQGEFNRQIHAKTPITRLDSVPSVTVASAFASSEDIVLSTPSSNHTSSSKLPTGGSSLPTPMSAKSALSPSPNIPSNPSPLNYASWPRKYPEWPPSASLGDRVVMFHGEGMEDMFATSPPKDHRHLRSLSAAPGSDGTEVNRPTPLRRSDTAVSAPVRPAGLARGRTLR